MIPLRILYIGGVVVSVISFGCIVYCVIVLCRRCRNRQPQNDSYYEVEGHPNADAYEYESRSHSHQNPQTEAVM